MNSSSKQAIIIHDVLCHYCKTHYDSDVMVLTIEQDVNSGWNLRGKGEIHTKCSCPVCGMMYTAVNRMIPIECDSYLCPTCNESSNLEYNVYKIERVQDSNDFTFKANITCKKCHNKKTLTKVIKKILNIKKIEIKLTGITIERY